MPAPDCSQCSRVAPHTALTMAGAPAVIPSTTVRENDSNGDGATSAWAPRSRPHLEASSIIPVSTMSRLVVGRVDDLPHQDEPEITGVALLVGAEVPPEDPRPLLVVHPARCTAGTARRPARTRPGPPSARSVGLFDPQADHHLRRGGDAEALDHQAALAAGVEGEAAALREQGVEDRQVQRRLLVGRRMEDGPLPHQGQAADRRVVEVGVEGDDVGVAGLHGTEQGGRLGALQVDPALACPPRPPARGRPAAGPTSGWKPSPRPASEAIRCTVTPLMVSVPSGSSSRHVSASSARGGEHLHLVAPIGDEVLGQHAGAGLRPPTDLRAVAGHHVGHLHDGTAAGPGRS